MTAKPQKDLPAPLPGPRYMQLAIKFKQTFLFSRITQLFSSDPWTEFLEPGLQVTSVSARISLANPVAT